MGGGMDELGEEIWGRRPEPAGECGFRLRALHRGNSMLEFRGNSKQNCVSLNDIWDFAEDLLTRILTKLKHTAEVWKRSKVYAHSHQSVIIRIIVP